MISGLMKIFSGARSLFEKYSDDPLLKTDKAFKGDQGSRGDIKLIKESDRHSVHLILLSPQRF